MEESKTVCERARALQIHKLPWSRANKVRTENEMLVYTIPPVINCGECYQQLVLGEWSKLEDALELKLACMNQHCSNFKKICKTTVKASEFEDTGETVPDAPAILTAQQLQQRH